MSGVHAGVDDRHPHVSAAPGQRLGIAEVDDVAHLASHRRLRSEHGQRGRADLLAARVLDGRHPADPVDEEVGNRVVELKDQPVRAVETLRSLLRAPGVAGVSVLARDPEAHPQLVEDPVHVGDEALTDHRLVEEEVLPVGQVEAAWQLVAELDDDVEFHGLCLWADAEWPMR